MSDRTVKLYELCGKNSKRIFSPACWRIRLACLHKGLKIESVPWRYTEKDAIKFADSEKVPVLVDGDHALKESYDIALYLERTYPDAPSLFGGPGGEVSIKFIDTFSIHAKDVYTPAIALDIWRSLEEKDQEYFRATREKRFGGTLEDLAKTGQERVKKFRKILEPLRIFLSSNKFVGGDQPNYGDYCLAAGFLTGRAVSKLEILQKGDPILDWLKRVLSRYEDNVATFTWEWELA